MKIDKNTIGLISEIEYKIGNSCYNPNSYDGYTGIVLFSTLNDASFFTLKDTVLR